jgi:hypothetical protein
MGFTVKLGLKILSEKTMDESMNNLRTFQSLKIPLRQAGTVRITW